MARVSSNNQVCTVMVRATVEPSLQRQVVESTEAIARTMSTLPGFLSMNVHRSLDGSEVVTYLQWKRREDHEHCASHPIWKDHPASAGTMKLIEAGKMKLDVKVYEVAHTAKKNFAAREISDFSLRMPGGEQLTLSQLFGDKQDMILIHNMGTKCPYCTLWADGFNGLYPHLADRAAFVVVSNDDPETQRKFAQSRGWRFPMLSAKDTDLFADLGFVCPPEEAEHGTYRAGVTTLRRVDGRLERMTSEIFGPGDDFCAAWHLFDLLDGGAKGWQPKFKY